jgi:hypothetical protein
LRQGHLIPSHVAPRLGQRVALPKCRLGGSPASGVIVVRGDRTLDVSSVSPFQEGVASVLGMSAWLSR